MPTTFTISIDWDRNNNFSGTLEDVTNRVMQVNWFLGSKKPWQDLADNPICGITLRNDDRRYSPDNALSPLAGKLLPQRPVRIQSNDGTTTRTHWLGWIEAIQPSVGRYGERTVKILASGASKFLSETETKLPLQQNKRTDEVISELIKEVVLPPALNQAWVLSRQGNSEVAQTTYLANTSLYSTLETGTLTLAIAGDNWVRQGGYSDAEKDSFDVYRAIGDITAAERGRFYFDRDGKAVFWNRTHTASGGTPVATFNDSMTNMTYSFAGLDHLKNEVVVQCHPRKISASTNDLLWKLENAVIILTANQTRNIYVKYDDENGQRVGARDVTVSGLTFSAGSATVTDRPSANGAELVFVAGGSGATITGCEVRGRKILDQGQMEAKATDGNSIIDFGRRVMRLNLPSIDNLEQAQIIADAERTKRSQARGMVQSLTVVSHGKRGGAQHGQQLARTIGDIIEVTETQTGHNHDYRIIGEAHELTHGATLWKTTWYLEPTP